MLGLSSAWKATLNKGGAEVFEPLLRALAAAALKGLVLDDGVSAEAFAHLRPLLSRGELQLPALRGAALRPRPREAALHEGEAPPSPAAERRSFPSLPPAPRRRSGRNDWFSPAADTTESAPSWLTAAVAGASTRIGGGGAASAPERRRGELFAYERRPRVASPDPDEREAAVAEHARTLELASEHHIGVLSVALGAIDPEAADPYLTLQRPLAEHEAEALARANRHASPIRARTFDGALFSLDALLRKAEPLGVRVAVENPPLPICLPSPDELFRLVAGFAGAPFAYAHDVAAARLCAELGGPPGREYLDVGKERLALVFLSDTKGFERGLVPGRGSVDFAGLAKALPPALHVLVPRPDWSERDVLEAAEHLRSAGLG